jgi:flagellar assembly protein FliH
VNHPPFSSIPSAATPAFPPVPSVPSAQNVELERRAGGRWIRPVGREIPRTGDDLGVPRDGAPSAAFPAVPNSAIEEILAREVEGRLARLLDAEREVEERLKVRVREATAALREREARIRKELADFEREIRVGAEEARMLAQKDGRNDGFREGFEKGADEGRRLGFEQGRIEGLREGKRSGQQSEESRWRRKTSEAVAVLARMAEAVERSKESLLREAQANVVDLAVRIAEKVIDRELRIDPRTTLGSARKAVEQIFRGCHVVLQVHPDDAALVSQVVDQNPRWAEDLAGIEVRPCEDIDRGGCRLLSGSGVIDMTISSQLELIERALRDSIECWTAPPSTREDHGTSTPNPLEGSDA